MIFSDECLCRTFVFLRQRLGTVLLTDTNLSQFSVHHDNIKDALFSTMEHMNVYWFMLVGVKVKDETEIFENLWHCLSILF